MKVVNFPRTNTILAIGVLAGGVISQSIDWNTALLMILTFYFTKHQDATEAKAELMRKEAESATDGEKK